MQNDEISDYESERLIIDCPHIILEPVAGDFLKRLNGPGSIIQKGGGGFLLKMFILGEIDIKSTFERINRLKSGKLIERSEYYQMSATDLKGNIWTCDKLYPHFSSNISTSKSIINADLFEISKVEPLPKQALNLLKMKFRGNFKIPVNTGSHLVKQVAGEIREEESKGNVCKFNSCKMEIEIIQEDEWMVIYASSAENKFDEGLTCRIIEALQFCMGRQLKWSCKTVIINQNEHAFMRGIILNDSKGRSYTPVDYNDHDNVKDTIHLIDCYLTKTIEENDTLVHPLFHPLYAVILASTSTTETEALTLATSVESLLTVAIKDIDKDEETMKYIGELKNHIDSTESYSEIFKKRLKGLLKMMESPSAVDKLNFLVKQGAINKDHVDMWKKLRPKLAHGNFSIHDFQEFLDMGYSIHVLMHHLIFHCIGYNGKYTDYSEAGWPTLTYPNRKKDQID